MKKLLLLFFALIMVGSVAAQDTIPGGKNATEKKPQKPVNKPKDMVAMKSGKMMLLKNGEWMPMTKKMKMKNGTKVKPDGSVVLPNGTKMVLNNGDRIDIDGKIILGIKPPVMKADSTKKK